MYVNTLEAGSQFLAAEGARSSAKVASFSPESPLQVVYASEASLQEELG